MNLTLSLILCLCLLLLYFYLREVGFFNKIAYIYVTYIASSFKAILEHKDESEVFTAPSTGEYSIEGSCGLISDAGTTTSLDPEIQEQINALSVDLLRVEEGLENTNIEVLAVINSLHNRLIKLETKKKVAKKKTVKRKTK